MPVDGIAGTGGAGREAAGPVPVHGSAHRLPTVDSAASFRPSETLLPAAPAPAPGGDAQPPRDAAATPDEHASGLGPPDRASRPWLASWPPGVPTGWQYPAVGTWRLVEDAIRDLPDGVALVDDRHALTWAQFGAVVDDVARGLASRGPDRVVLDCEGGLAAIVVAMATWRVGAVLEVRDPDERATAVHEADGAETSAAAPDDGGPTTQAPCDGNDEELVLLVVDRRRARADAGTAQLVRADVERLVRRRTDRSRLGRAAHAVRRRLRRHDRCVLSTLVDESGQAGLRPVDPDAPALELPVADGVATATQRQLVAATFQVRLWVPDVATGSEVVATSTGWWRPGGLVVGFLLAALTAGTCRVADADDLVATIPGATLAFAEPATWRGLASGGGWRGIVRRRRGEATGTELRLAGVVVRPGARALDDAAIAGLVQATEGARVRHFWQPDRSVGPVLAQPVYGRLAGDPGAVPLVDTVLAVHGGTTWAHGPQVPPTTADGWAALDDDLPLGVVTGAVARPASAVDRPVGTTWQRSPASAAPPEPRQESR